MAVVCEENAVLASHKIACTRRLRDLQAKKPLHLINVQRQNQPTEFEDQGLVRIEF